MPIDKYEFIHGAALVQVVNHPSFTALNRASERYGHYLINDDRHLFVKYSTSHRSPWQFTFRADDIDAIQAEVGSSPTFVALVCGRDGVAVIVGEAILGLFAEAQRADQQAIVVTRPSGGSYRVAGPRGQLAQTIPMNAFPDRILVDP